MKGYFKGRHSPNSYWDVKQNNYYSVMYVLLSKRWCVWQDFVFDIQLVNWYPKTGVRVLGETGDVVKRVVKESESWETPRAPFEVQPPPSPRPHVPLLLLNAIILIITRFQSKDQVCIATT
jgi:hypothetical protein